MSVFEHRPWPVLTLASLFHLKIIIAVLLWYVELFHLERDTRMPFFSASVNFMQGQVPRWYAPWLSSVPSLLSERYRDDIYCTTKFRGSIYAAKFWCNTSHTWQCIWEIAGWFRSIRLRSIFGWEEKHAMRTSTAYLDSQTMKIEREEKGTRAMLQTPSQQSVPRTTGTFNKLVWPSLFPIGPRTTRWQSNGVTAAAAELGNIFNKAKETNWNWTSDVRSQESAMQ